MHFGVGITSVLVGLGSLNLAYDAVVLGLGLGCNAIDAPINLIRLSMWSLGSANAKLGLWMLKAFVCHLGKYWDLITIKTAWFLLSLMFQPANACSVLKGAYHVRNPMPAKCASPNSDTIH